MKNQPIPNVSINLPPGVLEQAALESNYTMSKEEFETLHREATEKFKLYIESDKGVKDMMMF